MRVWHQRADGTVAGEPLGERCVVTIGVFDGVHRGHQRIIWRALARAAELRLPAVALTFDPLPEAVVRPHAAPLLLTTLARRLELLGELGLDAACVLDFDRDFAAQSPREFVAAVLAGALRAVDVVVGENFRFGHRAGGDVTMLRKLGAELGFMVEAVPLLRADGDRAFSSSWIRARVAAGDVAAAAVALGRPHAVDGVVVHGDHRGRTLGFPTANLDSPANLAVPADGVYAGWLDGMPAAISVGTNPTFSGTVRRVEAYVVDRTDLDLYGHHVRVDFAQRLRGMVAFDGIEPLIEQMKADVDQCRAVLARLPRGVAGG